MRTLRAAHSLFVAIALLAAGVVYGAGEEARVAALAAELRCLVCQNQSIAESNAELAVDLRRQIRTQIADGRSDDEIRDFMVTRYGDFVLYRPPLRATTILLWAGPALLLIAGFWGLRRALRERTATGDAPPLSEGERARAAELLAGEKRQ